MRDKPIYGKADWIETSPRPLKHEDRAQTQIYNHVDVKQELGGPRDNSPLRQKSRSPERDHYLLHMRASQPEIKT